MKKLKKVKTQKDSTPYGLRPKKDDTIFETFNVEEQDLKDVDIEGADLAVQDQYEDEQEDLAGKKRKRKPRVDILEDEFEYDKEEDQNVEIDDSDLYDDNLIIDKLPKKKYELQKLLQRVNHRISVYKKQFHSQQLEAKTKISFVSDNAIPINADIRTFNFELLRKKQLQFGQRTFDIIMMDPPWKLSSSQPSRGVAIQYDSLGDQHIEAMPIPTLQTDGFICIWAINAKYRFTCKLIEKWGYKLVDEITWVKKTVNGKIAKGHGFYLQHAKQSCLIGVKGNVDKNPRFAKNVASDVIFSERRGQSQKPTQVYEYLEKLVPNGFYLEIFGRRNNLRKNWVTIGNQI